MDFEVSVEDEESKSVQVSEDEIERIASNRVKLEETTENTVEPVNESLISVVLDNFRQLMSRPAHTGVVNDVHVKDERVVIEYLYEGTTTKDTFYIESEQYANFLEIAGVEHENILELVGETVPVRLVNPRRIDVPDNTSVLSQIVFWSLRFSKRNNIVSVGTDRFKLTEMGFAAVLLVQPLILSAVAYPLLQLHPVIGFIGVCIVTASMIGGLIGLAMGIAVLADTTQELSKNITEDRRWPF